MNRFIQAITTGAKDVGKGAEVAGKVALTIAPAALPLVPVVGPAAAETVKAVRAAIHPEVDSMNPLETMGISMVLAALQSVVKNPQHKAALQNQLIGVANDIYTAYGMTPPALPATATGTSA